MKYIVDHNKKHVHEQQYALGRCSVENVPFESIEYTNSHDYIRSLENEKFYVRCPYCHEVPLLID
ncbi:hypothetical protein QWY16_18495 [Planococcus shenhongbingii]|uniref:hypothetical protein n=1 Tax=Planococcus shenhongbingii TaxID=3058398 RepID=UPI002637AC24|nr:hypothetical protein [Planococcus sp. N016]WKA58459.1 hypothetical protein QWY16_18495 [Planococcus sp. N016]